MREEHRQILNDVFLAVRGRIWELERVIRPEGRPLTAQQQWSFDEMLTSQLGRDLADIIAYAEGYQDSALRVKRAIERVYRALFGSVLDDGYSVLKNFEKMLLGQIINQARVRMFQPEELLAPREVREKLGVARQTVYDWIAEGKLIPVYVDGKIMFPQEQVEQFQTHRRRRRG
jgi:predicted DNA-binding transcriptional regulator AlpA